MNIAFVTVNFNNADRTKKLLDSLLSQCDTRSAIIVVDNQSAPQDVGELSSYIYPRPRCVLIKNAENSGFAAGCNVGIAAALSGGADWVVLINNDTWVVDGFVNSLRQKLGDMSQTGPTGIVSIPLMEGDRTAYCGVVQWLRPSLQHIYDRSLPTINKKLLYAIGGGMAIHKDVFTKIGLFDERYFLYFEDADFSYRALHSKLSLTILDQPVIMHSVSLTTSTLGIPLLLRYHYRNALLFNLLYAPLLIKMMLPFWSIVIIVKQALKLVIKPRSRKASMAIAAGVIDFYLCHFGKII